jgi:hypothetical protein
MENADNQDNQDNTVFDQAHIFEHFEHIRADTEEYTPLETYRYHLIRAHTHVREALDLLYKSNGPKRSIWVRMLVGRAQNILIGLVKSELEQKNREDRGE